MLGKASSVAAFRLLSCGQAGGAFGSGFVEVDSESIVD